nr:MULTISPECIES: DUF4307 domain-containing protein [unclassified Leucobacter]
MHRDKPERHPHPFHVSPGRDRYAGNWTHCSQPKSIKLEVPVTSHDALADRYGTGRNKRIDRRVGWTIAVIAILAGLAVVLFGGWQQNNQVNMQNIGMDIIDDQTASARFSVTAPADAKVACSVEALNRAKATVGWQIIEVPTGQATNHKVTATIKTTGPAVSAAAHECWVFDAK